MYDEKLRELIKRLERKRDRINQRYKYYEMKEHIHEVREMLPPAYRWTSATLGWCAKTVDTLADRLAFYSFSNDYYAMGDIYLENNQDILIDAVMLSALICACSFIYITKDAKGVRLYAIDGADATGDLDPSTYLLKTGYAVLERDKEGHPVKEAYFKPGETYYYQAGYAVPVEVEKTGLEYAALVPVIYRPDARRPFGHSRISRACMDIQQGAMRTLKRAEISADFYSFPQRYILGTSEDREPMDKWRATMSSFIEITKDEDGDKPVMGQFSQQSMAPYLDQMRMMASLFAGETGLTVDDLGFVSDNPSSSEAIKAAHENLRLNARKAQKNFSTGLLNAGYLAACYRDKRNYNRYDLALTKTNWLPVFEPDFSALSSIGDGAIKLNQAVPGFINKDTLRDLTGIVGGPEEATTSQVVENAVQLVDELEGITDTVDTAE